MQPETYANPLVKQIGHALMTLPQRAIQSAANYQQGGDYDPGPILEAATLPMGGGLAGVPMRSGETALGAGLIRGSTPEAKADWIALRREVADRRSAMRKMQDTMQQPAPEHVDPYAGATNDAEVASRFEQMLRDANR